MRTRFFPGCLAACLLISPIAVGISSGQEDRKYQEYQLKKKELAGAADSVKQWEGRVKNAGTTYHRLKAQRQLEMAKKAHRDAKRNFEGVKRKIKPGDRAFEDETKFEGKDPNKVKDIGPSGPAKAIVVYSESAPTRGGSTGEVVYNNPRNQKPADQIRADPNRWKLRDKPKPAKAASESAPLDTQPSNTRKAPKKSQYVVGPGKLGGPGGGRAKRLTRKGAPLQNVDYIGKPVVFTFHPFDYEGPPKRGTSQKETLEEIGLIKAVKNKMQGEDFEGAQRDVERLMTLRPDDARVFHLASLVYNKMGQYKYGAEMADNAIRIGMNHPAVYESLAMAQLKLGLYQAALENAEKALELDSQRELAAQVRASAIEQIEAGGGQDADAPASTGRSPYAGSAASGPLGTRPSGASGRTSNVPAATGAAGLKSAKDGDLPPWAMPVGAVFSLLCAVGGFFLLRSPKT
jgi:tetratricopeptide (TPR) repeat protein